jgi:hypothetical protein
VCAEAIVTGKWLIYKPNNSAAAWRAVALWWRLKRLLRRDCPCPACVDFDRSFGRFKADFTDEAREVLDRRR